MIAYTITDEIGDIVIKCSNGRFLVTESYRDALFFLLQSAEVNYDVPRVVWNIADFVETLKEILPEFAIHDLESNTHRADWYERDIHFRLYYQPGKFFGLHAGGYGEETTFYELDQYFPDELEIDTVEYLQDKADELEKTFKSLGIERIQGMNSPVAVMEKSGIIQAAYKALPDPDDIPEGCKEYAVLSDTWGPWVAAYQIGYWPEGTNFSYDIASCYPSIASKLISLHDAEYIYSRKELSGYNYAFVKGTLEIDPDHPYAFCSPVVSAVDDVVTNPVGRIKGVFTQGKVNYILKHKLGRFRFYDGWYIYLHSDVRPLKPLMDIFYKRRQESNLHSMILKRVINGVIGRLGQYIHEEPTDMTNPVYHSIIRNYAPVKVGEFFIKNEIRQQELIHVNTDGFHMTREIDLPENAGMGEWRKGKGEDLIVLSSGKILEGSNCQELINQIKSDGENYRYGEINLLSLAGDQDRYFPEFPMNGKELLENKYQSEPLIQG